MYTLILTLLIGNSATSFSAPSFQTLALCEAAAASHIARVDASFNWAVNKKFIASCVKTSEK